MLTADMSCSRAALALFCCCIIVPPLAAQDASAFPTPDRTVTRNRSTGWASEAARDRYGEAGKVLEWLAIRPGDRVVDLDSGSGYYAVRLARLLGSDGVVYAEDSDPGYLAQLRVRLIDEGFSFVQLIQGEADDPRLPPGSVDVAIMAHRYNELENPYEFFYKLFPALTRGARIGIIALDRPIDRQGTPSELLRCEMAALGYEQSQKVLLTPSLSYLAIFSPPEALPPVARIKPCGPQ